MIDYIKILEDDQAEACRKIIEDLKDYYTEFPDTYSLSTLGAATYQHCQEKDLKYDRSEYLKIKEKINPVLMEKFRWLYEILINRIENIINEKCIISDEAQLAFPGFHILYAHEHSEKVTESIHLDLQWKSHLDSLEKIFKNVERDNFLTFTLCIKLPPGGGGLYYWPLTNPDKKYTYEEADQEYENLKYISEEIAPFNTDDSFMGCERSLYEEKTKPKIIEYKHGYMTFFRKPVLHQVMPFFPPFKVGDTRITLQGHGIKCDGIWRLYF